MSNIKISVVTKYSEYKPISDKLKIYKTLKFKNFLIDSFYFQIKSFLKIIKIHKKNPINILIIHQHTDEIE